MAYIDETYGKQLEEALRGLVSRPALGQPWFGFHESEVPAGVLLFTAATHSRILYADFWNYIQNKNLVKTEEEWQSIYNEQGWCPFYSDGDGIDTFRMPSAPLYLHGASTLSEAGQYTEEGLPNIVGKATYISTDSPNANSGAYATNGAFQWNTEHDRKPTMTDGASSRDLRFDASRSNSIYGNSSHVTPETSKMLFGVWAIAASQQPIPDATVEGIISELGIASNNAIEANAKAEEAIDGLDNVVHSTGDTMTGPLTLEEGDFGGHIRLKQMGHESGSVPSEAQYTTIAWCDKNGAEIGRIMGFMNLTGQGGITMRYANADGTYGPSFAVGTNADDTGFCTYDGKKLVTVESSSFTNNKGYIKFTNGLLIHWVQGTVTNNQVVTANFSPAFSSVTSYVVVATGRYSGSDYNWNPNVVRKSASQAQFNTMIGTVANNAAGFIAIGY